DSKEDEAFYKSDNLESIELCTIHSTKGLAYPMVILAQSEKGLHSNASGDMGLSFSSFTLKESVSKDYSAVGFKVGVYEPLIYRILKKISKNKHEAEKKRLLYVALTRAEHNLVIAGSVYEKADKSIGLTDNSYLSWLSLKSFNKIDKKILFNSVENDKIKFLDKSKFKDIKGTILTPNDLECVEYKEQVVEFKTNSKKTASNTKEHETINENISKQATLGTAIHSILERYWDRLEDENILETIYFKYTVFDDEIKSKIKHYLENFKTTTTYKKLKNGAEHHFEIELNMYKDGNQTQGVIDLIYFDDEKDGWGIVDFKSNNINGRTDLVQFAKDNGYDKQLDTYEMLCEGNGLNVIEKMLLFLDNGEVIKFK
ncbi:MAG: 3'-5' exonuclease, partial [Campylobacterota bacterium]|nr:3'-5' exonuclease [Campylobacterota bacterium]